MTDVVALAAELLALDSSTGSEGETVEFVSPWLLARRPLDPHRRQAIWRDLLPQQRDQRDQLVGPLVGALVVVDPPLR